LAKKVSLKALKTDSRMGLSGEGSNHLFRSQGKMGELVERSRLPGFVSFLASLSSEDKEDITYICCLKRLILENAQKKST
jgi:hypothetical protein